MTWPIGQAGVFVDKALDSCILSWFCFFLFLLMFSKYYVEAFYAGVSSSIFRKTTVSSIQFLPSYHSFLKDYLLRHIQTQDWDSIPNKDWRSLLHKARSKHILHVNSAPYTKTVNVYQQSPPSFFFLLPKILRVLILVKHPPDF